MGLRRLWKLRIPDEVESAQVAPLLCAGLIVYSALKRSMTVPGQWVVISGTEDGLGHLAVQFASKRIGLRLIGIDQGQKAELAKNSASYRRGLYGFVNSLTGRLGAHTVIVCTAANSAHSQGVQFLRFGSTLVWVGLPAGEQKPIASATPGGLIAKQLKIMESAVGNRIVPRRCCSSLLGESFRPTYRRC
ncbi:hypothetical protein N7537_010185 [Penicillium hordei]|uniref:Alcohol dehydrogenase-like C-terminal domain-containing protein n=1 Tax=Penicillium hordei TaxID=40994 RepID=A0AAD6GVG4_9EURO|nr:uncharacterized protein N7537_010185 [Penicillium hordei]KAJ5593281.1 hypothetical protein N7537_010185 [Penicillium hordei]